MRIVFYDPADWDYDGLTPLTDGLGGSQSAMVYLSAELAGRGHDVTLVNGAKWIGARHINAVRFVGQNDLLSDEIIKTSDVLIVLNAAMAMRLRRAGVLRPMVLWTHHDVDQPPMQDLFRYSAERATWAAIVGCSEWQARRYRNLAAIDMRVIHNAAAWPFHTEPIRPLWCERGVPPVLVYTSTPFRGLAELLWAFPKIREAFPLARLKVFSDMKLYRVADEDDEYRNLYRMARRTTGVDYIGSIGQQRLAHYLAGCALLAYPCTFPETYCIAAAEAVTVGCEPVVPALGALPEVLGGCASYYTGDFATAVIDILKMQAKRPRASDVARVAAAGKFRAESTWAKRAVEWEAMLTTVLAL